MKNLLFSISIFLITFFTFGQEVPESNATTKSGYKIKVNPENYLGDKMQLAYHFSNKQYVVKDALTNSEILTKRSDGTFVFSGKEPLETGVYMLVFLPKKDILEFIVTKKDQHIEIKFNYNKPSQSLVVSGGSNENKLFTDYLNFINLKSKQASNLVETDLQYNNKLTAIRNDMSNYQEKLFKDNPNSLTTSLVKASIIPEAPKFDEKKSSIQDQTIKFYQKHFFDNINLGDPRLLRTPILFDKVNTYIDKLYVQQPDSIIKALDFVLKKMEPAQETFKTFMIYFLNKYAKSKVEGMEMVYVHLVNEYYAKGKATWIEETQLKKILQDAAEIEEKNK